MSLLIVLAALCFLMFVAYRGYRVILFAPIAALGAVLLTDPTLVAPVFTGLFMDKPGWARQTLRSRFVAGGSSWQGGRAVESSFSKSIVSSVIKLVGRERAVLSIVDVGALLTLRRPPSSW